MERRAPNVLVDYAWYQDGVGMIGLVTKVKLPPLTRVVEDYIASGMVGSIKLDMGMIETDDIEITIAELSPSTVILFGLSNGNEKPFTFRAAYKGSGSKIDAFKVQIYGRVIGLDLGDLERKKVSEVNCKITWTKLKMEYASQVLVDLDLLAGKEIVGGVDRRAGINAALGI